MDSQFIILIYTFAILFISFFTILMIHWRKDNKRREQERDELKWLIKDNQYQMKELEEKVFSTISDSRKYIEEKMYGDSKFFTKDSANFIDSNRIILDTKGNTGEMLIHKQLPDFSFFEGMAINLANIQVNDKMVACLMPFNPEFDEIKYTIAEACLIRGYRFRRSDDELIKDNNDLRKSIIQMILEAKMVVAVLDGRNPNVYYEIGIAQSMGKLVFMVVNMNEHTAFDVSPNRLITYRTLQELKTKLVEKFDAVRFAQ